MKPATLEVAMLEHERPWSYGRALDTVGSPIVNIEGIKKMAYMAVPVQAGMYDNHAQRKDIGIGRLRLPCARARVEYALFIEVVTVILVITGKTCISREYEVTYESYLHWIRCTCVDVICRNEDDKYVQRPLQT